MKAYFIGVQSLGKSVEQRSVLHALRDRVQRKRVAEEICAKTVALLLVSRCSLLGVMPTPKQSNADEAKVILNTVLNLDDAESLDNDGNDDEIGFNKVQSEPSFSHLSRVVDFPITSEAFGKYRDVLVRYYVTYQFISFLRRTFVTGWYEGLGSSGVRR